MVAKFVAHFEVVCFLMQRGLLPLVYFRFVKRTAGLLQILLHRVIRQRLNPELKMRLCTPLLLIELLYTVVVSLAPGFLLFIEISISRRVLSL